ncbi:MAG: site-specific DNA-methyltransferase [Xanthomonadales bacterium]|nr:site-specific DNA-methyltransferase [Xanthomonadales bacterium]
MEKLDLTTPDFTNKNIAKLAELFSNCVTEKKNSKGEIERAIDFDALRQELSDTIVEGQQERYSLNWPGKREALVTANTPISKTLRPCRDESVDFDSTQNIFIEGDNLDALKLLQETYLNKIKMIYIDPPYNTGNDFIYNDNFTANKDEYDEASGQRDDEGGRLVANPDSNGRFHSDWLSMMYPRIKLARNLLRDDGVMFISIGDDEQANLKRLCDEIFGEDNFLGTIVWKKKTNGNNVGYIPPVHDYILTYGRSAQDDILPGFPITQDFIDKTYSNPDKDPRGLWTTSDLSANHIGPHFPITNPHNNKVYSPPRGRYWVFNEKEVLERIKNGRIIFGKSGAAAPIQKKYLSERNSMRFKPESWWDKQGMNSDGTTELSDIFSPKIFNHPKPTLLLKNLINIASKSGGIILDFFSGSGTTPHAVMKLNAEDGGNRKCISVQLPEETDKKSEAFKAGYKNIAELSKERIRRAGKKIKQDNAHKEGIGNLDTGFRVFKIDSSNMVDVTLPPDEAHPDMFDVQVFNIKKDRSSEDLLFQVLLDWGVDLTLPIERKEIEGKEVFFVDDNTLAACFDKGINEDFVKELAKKKPLRVVFRDDGFTSDAVKINVEQIFKLKSPATDIKVI